MSEAKNTLPFHRSNVKPEIAERMRQFAERIHQARINNPVPLNSGTFPDPRQNERRWFCYSTALAPCWLMLQCSHTGAEGVVKDPTSEEWSWAFDAPSNPKLWTDNARVTLMEEGSR